MNWETDDVDVLTPTRLVLTDDQRKILRERFRGVLAHHGRVTIDDLDQALDDLLLAVTA